MSDMGTLSHSEATVSCISYYAEPDRQPIRSIRTLNGRTNKFGWLQARNQDCRQVTHAFGGDEHVSKGFY